MTVAELHEELRSRELPRDGRKADLVARLEEAGDGSTKGKEAKTAGGANKGGRGRKRKQEEEKDEEDADEEEPKKGAKKGKTAPTKGAKGGAVRLASVCEGSGVEDSPWVHSCGRRTRMATGLLLSPKTTRARPSPFVSDLKVAALTHSLLVGHTQ